MGQFVDFVLCATLVIDPASLMVAEASKGDRDRT